MSTPDDKSQEKSLSDDSKSLLPAADQSEDDTPDVVNRFFVRRLVPMTDDAKFAYVSLVCRTGLITQSALDVGVSIETARNHRNSDEEFGQAVQLALDVYRDSLSKEVHRRGVTGVNQPVFYMGRKCGVVRKYSDKLLEMHLKRHIPEYRDHLNVDATVTGGVMVIPAGPQSVEDWENQHNAPLEVIDVNEVEEIPQDHTTERS